MTDFASTMPFAKLLGIEIDSASAEGVVGRMVVRPELCTVGASIHGGALMAFADSVAAVGAFLALPEGAKGTTTIDSKSSFVGRAAEGVTLEAHAEPVSIGQRMSVWQTRITAPEGRLVALVVQTQLVLRGD